MNFIAGMERTWWKTIRMSTMPAGKVNGTEYTGREMFDYFMMQKVINGSGARVWSTINEE